MIAITRVVAALLLAPLAGGGVRAECPDLALVLAIDGSGSIDVPEYGLQQAGYAAAFRAADVQHALATAGRVDVAVVVWGDSEMAAQVVPWQRIEVPQDAERLARIIAGLPRRVSGNTGIGSGLSTALDLLDAPGHCAVRDVINVSGDGKETLSPHPRINVPLVVARSRAMTMGVTVNGLAITSDHPDLALWYADRVITGQDAFVMQVTGFETFAAALQEKLVREIRPPMVAAQSVLPSATAQP